jgi:hypothetical protein
MRGAVLVLVAMVGAASVARSQTSAVQASGSTNRTAATVVTIPAGSPGPGGGSPVEGFVTNPYAKEPPSFTLIAKTPGARMGKVWVRSDGTGLHLWGSVEGGAPVWPEQKADLLAKDHVEVWLAAVPDVTMPPVGWGNQFGKIEMKSAEDCKGQTDPQTGSPEAGGAACVRWYAEQVRYRAQFRRLFARQWLLAGSTNFGRAHVVEAYATEAWRTLEGDLFAEDLPDGLEPKAAGLAKGGVNIVYSKSETGGHDAAGNAYQKNVATGYEFYLEIPWEAFPPAPSLEVSDLWLMVDVFGAAPTGKKTGEYATTSAGREWGVPASFNHVKLEAARGFRLSPCEEPLVEQNIYEDQVAAWFFPVRASEKPSWLGTDFIVTNPAGGYDYAPTGVSPEAEAHTHFWKPLDGGGWVCGPRLAVKRGSVTKGFPFFVDEKTLDARVLGDGWLLVRSGPSASMLSVFGSGQCGACTVANVNFYAISPEGEVTPALELSPALGAGAEEPDAVDFTIAPDWKQVTEYDEATPGDDANAQPAWSSTTYCLEGHGFVKCGEEKDVQPPNPPHYREFQGVD